MSFAILLSDLIAIGLLSLASFEAVYVASLAPKSRLCRAWLAMTGLLAVVIGLGIFAAVYRFLSGAINPSVVVDTSINVLGASVIFAAVLLSRWTARDLLRMTELELAAFTDDLTGLPNRRSFDAAFPMQVEIAHQRDQPLALLSLDIDNFKRVNDEHGHEWGDKVLTHLGKLLAAHTRKGDIAYRVGGEEFAILMLYAELVQGQASAERLRLVIESSPLTLDRRKTSITVSFGVAMLHYKDDGSSLVNRADAALYLAKRTGRNRVCTEDDLALTVQAASSP